MKNVKLFFVFMLALFSAVPGAALLAGQEPPRIRPAMLGSPMPDFKLPAVQGGEYGISALKGKNILLIFPRGKVADHWCQICHYQYAELAELEKNLGLRKKFNLEILFVLPYDKATVEHWVSIFPSQLEIIEQWKNPGDPATLTEEQKRRQASAMRLFPKTLPFDKDKPQIPFPILIDADQTVSKGLGLFTTEWGGSKVDQNIPTVYIIDAEGIVRFKYISQNTVDRPPFDALILFMDRMLKSE